MGLCGICNKKAIYNFKNSKNLLTDEQMKNVKGGQRDITCTATNEEGSSRSFTNSNADLMLAWGRAWDAAGYKVSCHYAIYV